MRRRITSTMVGLTAGALLLATVGTALVSWLGARADAERDLARQARQIAQLLDEAQRPAVLNALATVLRLQDARITNRPPPALDVDTVALRQGRTVSGTRGRLVYAVAAVPRAGDTLLYVVLTRRVDARLGAGLWFALVAGATLAVAVAVASGLSRRLTRPLREAQAATRRIAGGDLSARVPVNPEDGEELAGLARSINGMAAGLERARGLERQFLLSVSHDLRTPLTSIRGYAEALVEGEAPDPAHAAGVILGESRRLERLVQDLLELARLDARRFSLDIRDVEVAEVLGRTAEAFRPAAEKAGVAVEVAGETATVAADPDRLAQVLANLVENGLKYATSRIVLAARAAGPQIEISVEDDGPGIAPDDLPHVFEPFFHSARRPARDVGTGLGLAIVRELVDAMGGSVSAAGTRLVVVLPAPTPDRRAGRGEA